jgi:hypothetical protein
VTTLFAAVLVLVFGLLGTAKLAAVPPMRTAAHHLGFTTDQYRVLGALELAGALGILVGAVAAPIGIAAGIGLGLLMFGAVAAHVVRRDPLSRIAPAIVVAALVVAYVLHML